MPKKGESRYLPYTEDMQKWREEGLSIRKIMKKLEEKGLDNPSFGGVRNALELSNKFEDTLDEAGFAPPNDWEYGWVKTKGASVFVKNDSKKDDFNSLKDGFLEYVKQHAPKYPKIDRTAVTDAHLLVVDPCDIHIGKLADSFETGEEYNSEIAVRRVKEGVQGILSKSAPYNVDKILLILGNDILHVDTPRSTTTSGTPQDTDGMWYTNFLKAKQVMIEVIEMLMTRADVHCIFNPSNHDFMSGFFLVDSIKSWFSKCEHVTFDADMKHRKYFQYGENIIGTTHGDGAKQADLPLLMAHESGQGWMAKHKYYYLGHLHHKVSKDYMGVNVEVMRSASASDGWHHRNGYQHAPKAIEGFLHHPLHGQVARFVHIF
jgi:hypothetical protein